jgi:hypothetical protein
MLNGPRPYPSFPIYYSLPSDDTDFYSYHCQINHKPVTGYFITSEFLIYFSISHFYSFILSSLPHSLYQFCSAAVFHIVQASVSFSLLSLHYDSNVLSVPRARFEPATTLFEQRSNMYESDRATVRICEAGICVLCGAKCEVDSL